MNMTVKSAAGAVVGLGAAGFLGIVGIASVLWGIGAVVTSIVAMFIPSLINTTTHPTLEMFVLSQDPAVGLIWGSILLTVGAMSFNLIKFVSQIIKHLTKSW
ncbi:MAG TPA: hypothetical protein VD973_04085 [Symbiobacteriaceae bacterium]|nr:hypothetical protein [Symbiobacteriaceae bacterium]